MNPIIRSDQGDLLYGHQLLKRIIDTGQSNEGGGLRRDRTRGLFCLRWNEVSRKSSRDGTSRERDA